MKPLEELARTIEPGSKLLRTWELGGGVSAAVTAFEIGLPDGRAESLVARRHGSADRKRDEHVAAHEFRLLQLLRAAGVRAPTPRHLDAEVLVLGYVAGGPPPATIAEAELAGQLARVLVEIHRAVPVSDLTFLPQLEPQANEPVLLHGDFWPGNTIWKDGRLVAVIDWEDAAVGDPLVDVANARLELLWARGADAMEAFTRAYRSLAPAVDYADLPSWDLWADRRLTPRIGEWGLDASVEQAMRAASSAFVARARERLS